MSDTERARLVREAFFKIEWGGSNTLAERRAMLDLLESPKPSAPYDDLEHIERVTGIAFLREPMRTMIQPKPVRRMSVEKSKKVRSLLRRNHGDRCIYCQVQMSFEPDAHGKPDQATLEHLIRLVDGGNNNYKNLALACRACNHRRNEEDNARAK